MHLPNPKSCYIVWNKPLQALASMLMHTRQNICALIKEATSPLNGSSLKLVDKFTYLRQTSTHIDRLLVIWKSDLPDKMKRSSFQAVVVLILLYGCTTWTLTKHMEKKLDGNYTRMLQAILNKSWRQHPIKQQLYGHLLPIMKTIQVRWTRHAGHCWRSKDEIISDILQWTPSHGRAKAGRPAKTYIQQLFADMGYNPENLLEAMDDREGLRERDRDISADGVTWWWNLVNQKYGRFYLKRPLYHGHDAT